MADYDETTLLPEVIPDDMMVDPDYVRSVVENLAKCIEVVTVVATHAGEVHMDEMPPCIIVSLYEMIKFMNGVNDSMLTWRETGVLIARQ